jgi:hypothetical protein
MLYVAPLLAFVTWPPRIGDDWLWYRDGVDRLAAGLPLFEPDWLIGPFNYLDPSEYHKWNQTPSLLPLVAPFAVLPEPIDRFAWTVAMAAVLATAVFWVVPNRLHAMALLVWPPSLMTIAYGNTESLVVLGVAAWLMGSRRNSELYEAAGIVLASFKIFPAVPLVLLSLRNGHLRSLAYAAAALLALNAPAMLAGGIDVIRQFFVISLHMTQVLVIHNLSPAMWLQLPIEVVRAIAGIAVVGALAIKRDWLAMGIGQLAAVAIPLNTYVPWLIPPALAVLARPSGSASDESIERS